jgi:uncharacterized protein YcsI (UPF0317 family)
VEVNDFMSIKERTKSSLEELAAMNPKDFRQMVRQNQWDRDVRDCLYYCHGYTQHGVAVLPVDYAFEFLAFCLRNPRAFPVGDVCEAGSPHPSFLAPDADIRTDCGQYNVYQDGVLIDEPTDLKKYWRDDMVAFFLGCINPFVQVMRDRRVNFRFMGVFTSNIRCVPFGRFKCDNMIVVCLLFATSLDAVRAVQISTQLSVSHGYPIYIGDPAEVGVDLMHPDIINPYPDSPPLPQQAGEVCMIWPGTVTHMNVIKAVKPPLAMTAKPAMTFVSDRRTEEFQFSFTT